MRILLLNPNSTQMVTQRIQRAAAPYQSAELEITAATAKKAPPAIETAMDELQASIAVLEELEARKRSAADRYREAGADLVIDSILDLPAAIEELNRRMAQKEAPTC